MREDKTFGQRSDTLTRQEYRKYLLVFEGSKTESIYFKALWNMRQQVGLSTQIELIPIIRGFSEDGWSNPKKLLDRVNEALKESKEGSLSYRSFFDAIISYLVDSGLVKMGGSLPKTIFDKLKDECLPKNGKLDEEIQDIAGVCGQASSLLEREFQIVNLLPIMDEIIENQKIDFDENRDSLCLIVDRDRESFTAKQYKRVLQECQSKKGYGFFVTNPCFEFWLLLHYDESLLLDKGELKKNAKVDDKTFCESELSKVYPGYDKRNYDAAPFISNIDKAMQNEARFCEDIAQLMNDVGSNIGLLVKGMRENH